jgi:hypothetical protein
MTPHKHGALTLSNSSKADLHAEKGSCHAWIGPGGCVICPRGTSGGMRPDCDLWPPRRVRRGNVGRCRCIQLLAVLVQAPDARGKLETVCLLKLGSCEGLKPARESIKCEQSSWEEGLNRLISCRKILAG